MTRMHAFRSSRFVGMAMLAASLAAVAVPRDAHAAETISMGEGSLVDGQIATIIKALQEVGELDGSPDLARFIDPQIAAILDGVK